MEIPVRRARSVALVAGAYAAVGGAITLAGWAFDVHTLRAWDGSISMKANPAVCAVAAGVSLLLLATGAPRGRLFARLLGAFIALVGGVTLAQHVTGIDAGIDTLLFDELPGALATAAPGRMGPPASTSYLLIGVGLVLATFRSTGRRVASALGVAVLVIAALPLAGYLYGASQLYAFTRLTGIALQTATMLAALGAGLVAIVPEHGMAAMLRRDDAGGIVLRRLAVPVVAFPVAVGWLQVRGQQADLYDGPFGTAAFALLMMGALFALVWWTAGGIGRRDALLREADRRKDEFLATLAHELRNPLAPMRNAVEIQRLSDDPALHARARDVFERQLRHMVRLVDDLLDVSRISRGRLELRREPVSLASVVATAVETVRPLAESRQHELHVELPADPIVLDADPTRLSQVFANLLDNAVKYTGSGGRIRLVAERRGSEVEVTVRDDGPGISAADLPGVFDMFFRAHREGEQGGLGIGLALVRRLVEMHGGRVDAKSEGTGRGSEFAVRLPLSTAAPPAGATEPRSVRGAAAPLRVLVVDDSRDGAETLEGLVALLGHEVRTAYDGTEALRTAEEFQPDLILMDIGMPKLDGLEVTRRIRSEAWGRTAAIHALTGWGQAADRLRSAEAGCDGHLVKPVDPDVLGKLLGEVGTRRRAGS